MKPKSRDITPPPYLSHPQHVVEALEEFVSKERRQRISEVVVKRSRGFIPVLDRIYDRGNASAVLRTLEGLGFLEANVIELAGEQKAANRVTQGADKWLEVRSFKNAHTCFEQLKERGYQVIATALDPKAVRIGEVDFSRKTAVVFGSEGFGVSEDVLNLCDQKMMIPMDGFAQSFNISVAAALTAQFASLSRAQKRSNSPINLLPGDLTPEEQEALKAKYYWQSVKQPEKIYDRYNLENR